MSKGTLRFTSLTAIILTIVALTVYLFASKGQIEQMRVIIDTAELRNGDLLFRNGNGVESRFVTRVGGGEYSHIAMAYRNENGWMAVHAVPGETENAGDTDFLKIESIKDFYKPDRARSGAIARVNCSGHQAEASLKYAIDKAKQKFEFDHKYELADSSKFYCTELIYRAFLTQGIDLADNRRHELPMPGTEGYFIFPSDILSSQYIQYVKVLKSELFINP